MNIFHARQGQMETSFCYFYTDTIYGFKHLLADESNCFSYRLVPSPAGKQCRGVLILFGINCYLQHHFFNWLQLPGNIYKTSTQLQHLNTAFKFKM